MPATATYIGPGFSREQTYLSVSLPAETMPVERLTPTHRTVLDYWRQQRGDAAVPRRAAFHPFDIPRTLANLAVWDAEAGDEFRCRLAGTEVERELNLKLTGVALGALPCPLLAEAQREFALVRDRALLNFTERTMLWVGKPHRYYRHLLLPLANDAGVVHMLLSVLTFHSVAERYDESVRGG